MRLQPHGRYLSRRCRPAPELSDSPPAWERGLPDPSLSTKNEVWRDGRVQGHKCRRPLTGTEPVESASQRGTRITTRANLQAVIRGAGTVRGFRGGRCPDRGCALFATHFGALPQLGDVSRAAIRYVSRSGWQRAGQHSGDPGTDSPSQVRRRGGRLARRGAGHGQRNGARRCRDRTLRLRSVAVVRTGPRSGRRLAASVASDRVDAVRGADETATLAPARGVGRRRPPEDGLAKLGAARCRNEEMIERVRAVGEETLLLVRREEARSAADKRRLLLIAGRRGRYGRAGVHRRDRRGRPRGPDGGAEGAGGWSARFSPRVAAALTPRPCGTANTTTPTVRVEADGATG